MIPEYCFPPISLKGSFIFFKKCCGLLCTERHLFPENRLQSTINWLVNFFQPINDLVKKSTSINMSGSTLSPDCINLAASACRGILFGYFLSVRSRFRMNTIRRITSTATKTARIHIIVLLDCLDMPLQPVVSWMFFDWSPVVSWVVLPLLLFRHPFIPSTYKNICTTNHLIVYSSTVGM